VCVAALLSDNTEHKDTQLLDDAQMVSLAQRAVVALQLVRAQGQPASQLSFASGTPRLHHSPTDGGREPSSRGPDDDLQQLALSVAHVCARLQSLAADAAASKPPSAAVTSQSGSSSGVVPRKFRSELLRLLGNVAFRHRVPARVAPITVCLRLWSNCSCASLQCCQWRSCC
jgi:hypothetical protein